MVASKRCGRRDRESMYHCIRHFRRMVPEGICIYKTSFPIQNRLKRMCIFAQFQFRDRLQPRKQALLSFISQYVNNPMYRSFSGANRQMLVDRRSIGKMKQVSHFVGDMLHQRSIKPISPGAVGVQTVRNLNPVFQLGNQWIFTSHRPNSDSCASVAPYFMQCGDTPKRSGS